MLDAGHVTRSCDVRNEFDSNGFNENTPTHFPEIFHKAAILTVVKIEFFNFIIIYKLY